jgi:acetyltransferase
VLASWIGADATVASTFAAADVPHYATEADAVRGFMHLVRYVQARDALMETPPSLPEDFAPDVAAARRPIEEALRDGRRWLDPLAAAQVLTAYGIATVPTALAGDPDHAGALAQPFLATGDSIVVKIQSPDIVVKSDIGGVRLGLIRHTRRQRKHCAAMLRIVEWISEKPISHGETVVTPLRWINASADPSSCH